MSLIDLRIRGGAGYLSGVKKIGLSDLGTKSSFSFYLIHYSRRSQDSSLVASLWPAATARVSSIHLLMTNQQYTQATESITLHVRLAYAFVSSARASPSLLFTPLPFPAFRCVCAYVCMFVCLCKNNKTSIPWLTVLSAPSEPLVKKSNQQTKKNKAQTSLTAKRTQEKTFRVQLPCAYINESHPSTPSPVTVLSSFPPSIPRSSFTLLVSFAFASLHSLPPHSWQLCPAYH